MKVIILACLSIILYSCNNHTSLKKKISKKELSIDEKIKIVEDFSFNIVGKDEYYKFLDLAFDSLIKNKLYKNEAIIDSIICFNKQKNKCILGILIFNLEKTNYSDYLQCYYGVKIKNKWYFFKGSGVLLPRYLYTKNVKKALSYNQMHKIAYNEIFRNYLVYDENETKINDNFFNLFTNPQRFGSQIVKKDKPTQEDWNWNYIHLAQRVFYKEQKKSWLSVYKPSDIKIYHNSKKHETILAMKVHKWHGFPIGYNYKYTIQSSFMIENDESNWDTNDRVDKYLSLDQDSIRIVIQNSQPNDDINFRIKFDVFHFENDYMHFSLKNGKAKFVQIYEIPG